MFSLLLFIQIFCVLLLFIACFYIFQKWSNRLHGILFFYCISVLVNNVGYLMEMLAQNEGEYLIALKLSYLGRVWIPFSLFLFVMKICAINYKKWLFPALSLIHFSVWLMVMTVEHHSLYYSSMEYKLSGAFPHIECAHGFFYNLYSLIIITYIVFGLYCIVKKTLQQKNTFARRRYGCVTIAVALQSVYFVISISNILDAYDATMIGYTLGTVFMYISIFRYNLLDNLDMAKEYLADEVSEAFVVCNEEGCVEYMNKHARQLQAKMGSQEEFLEYLSSISEDGSAPGERIHRATDVVLNDESKNIHVNLNNDSVNNSSDNISGNSSNNEVVLNLGDKVYSVQKEVLSHNGFVTGMLFVFIDDTEHYNYLEELKHQKELAEKASESKSRFISVVSHELRTPMNAVVGMTELLLRDGDNLDDKQEKYLKHIRSSGKSLVMIVNDILDQSKIEAGKMEIVEEAYELRPMIEDVAMILEERLGSRPVSFENYIDDKIPGVIIGDSLRIRQILINLCNNAAKFTEKGYIRLSITCSEITDKDIRLLFSIKDSGQGIKKEDLAKLGEAFAQVDTVRNHGKEGTGLGLSISREFIGLMGGSLNVRSEYGEGTEFYFEIKQDLCTRDNDENSACKKAWQEEESFTCPDLRILVIDDMSINLMIFKELLKDVKANVTAAPSGEMALKILDKKEFDIIFTDYMMPDMNGIETTRKMREKGTGVPIIALTGDDSDEVKDEFIKAGANDFAIKPVIITNIKEVLMKWVPDKCIREE